MNLRSSLVDTARLKTPVRGLNPQVPRNQLKNFSKSCSTPRVFLFPAITLLYLHPGDESCPHHVLIICRLSALFGGAR